MRARHAFPQASGLLSLEREGWQSKMEDNFQVRRYLFDSRLQSTKDFSELMFDGRASSIGAALKGVAERYKGQPLAGVLLLTDGNATDLPDGIPDLSGLPPIYPVVIGTGAGGQTHFRAGLSESSASEAGSTPSLAAASPDFNPNVDTIGVVSISDSRDYLDGLMKNVERQATRIANNHGADVADSFVEYF